MRWWMNIYLPAGVGDLATGLADYIRNQASAHQIHPSNLIADQTTASKSTRTVQADDLTHGVGGLVEMSKIKEG